MQSTLRKWTLHQDKEDPTNSVVSQVISKLSALRGNKLFDQQQHLKPQTTNSKDKSKWVIKLSRHDINKDEKEQLEIGMNFSITPTTIPAIDLVSQNRDSLSRNANRRS